MRWWLRLLVLLLLVFLAMPALVACIVAFDARSILNFPPQSWSTRWFERAMTYPDFRDGAWNSLLVMVSASVIATLLGAGAALALQKLEFRGKRILEALVMAPLVVPHFVVGLGFLTLFAQSGLPRGLPLLVLCHVVLVLPFVVRSVWISLKSLDGRLEDAALSLGAPPGQVLRQVTLPLLLPGLAGGWLFAAILSFTEFSASLFVSTQRTQTLPVAMYNYVREYADPSIAALSAIWIVTTMLLILAADRWLGLSRVLGTEVPGGR